MISVFSFPAHCLPFPTVTSPTRRGSITTYAPDSCMPAGVRLKPLQKANVDGHTAPKDKHQYKHPTNGAHNTPQTNTRSPYRTQGYPRHPVHDATKMALPRKRGIGIGEAQPCPPSNGLNKMQVS